MNQNSRQRTILLFVFWMICVALAAPLSAQETLAPAAPPYYIACTLPNVHNGVGCVIMFTYGSTSTVAKGIIAAEPTPATHHIWLVCQTYFPTTVDVTTPVPVEFIPSPNGSPGRQVIAFSCPDDAGGLVLRCDVGDRECALTYVP